MKYRICVTVLIFIIAFYLRLDAYWLSENAVVNDEYTLKSTYLVKISKK